VQAVASAVRTHLFLLCPNNSGSTFLSQAIARSSNVWSLPTEGQRVFGFAGPSTAETIWPLIWGGSAQSRAHFADAQYDWERTRKAWYYHAEADHPAAPIFHTRSPPFLLIADQLRDNFSDARFLLMVRDPYATLEGITRRRRRSPTELGDGAGLATFAARHLVTCFKQQLVNLEALSGRCVFFTYEEMCADPDRVTREIIDLVPDIGGFDLAASQAVKGIYQEPLRNMNHDQIARLCEADRKAATAVFREHLEVFERFGYDVQD
jgi:hypothetical protein